MHRLVDFRNVVPGQRDAFFLANHAPVKRLGHFTDSRDPLSGLIPHLRTLEAWRMLPIGGAGELDRPRFWLMDLSAGGQVLCDLVGKGGSSTAPLLHQVEVVADHAAIPNTWFIRSSRIS